MTQLSVDNPSPLQGARGASSRSLFRPAPWDLTGGDDVMLGSTTSDGSGRARESGDSGALPAALGGAVRGIGDGDRPQPVLDGDGKRGALA